MAVDICRPLDRRVAGWWSNDTAAEAWADDYIISRGKEAKRANVPHLPVLPLFLLKILTLTPVGGLCIIIIQYIYQINREMDAKNISIASAAELAGAGCTRDRVEHY